MEWFVISTSHSSDQHASTFVWSLNGTVHHTLKNCDSTSNGSLVVCGEYYVATQALKSAIHVWNLPHEAAIKHPVPEKCKLVILISFMSLTCVLAK